LWSRYGRIAPRRRWRRGDEALKEAGNSDCKIVARFDTCGACAASKTSYGAGWGSTLEAAKAMANDKCEGSCKVLIAKCE